MSREPGCAFCDIVAGTGPARVLSRDRGVTVFFPDEPATQGHTLVIPDKHVADVWELDQGEGRNLASEVMRISHAVRSALRPDGLNIIQSNGAAAEQTVNHLHVHILPRWPGDAVGKIWPQSPPWTSTELDATQSEIEAAIGVVSVPGYDLSNAPDREDRRKHLDLVSAVISRLAGASAATKGWAITLAGAAFGTALVWDRWPLIALGLLVMVAFAALDARYLESERRARGLYNAIVEKNAVAPFSMMGLATSTSSPPRWWPARFRAWSIWYFYAPMILGGLALLALALLGFTKKA